jgi:hypothetical protein
LIWQAGSLKNYQNTIFGQLLAIIEKNGKSFGKLQASALTWEFICTPGQENLNFLQVKKREMTGKTKNIVSIEALCILERHC